jgi:hypothetical protein
MSWGVYVRKPKGLPLRVPAITVWNQKKYTPQSHMLQSQHSQYTHALRLKHNAEPAKDNFVWNCHKPKRSMCSFTCHSHNIHCARIFSKVSLRGTCLLHCMHASFYQYICTCIHSIVCFVHICVNKHTCIQTDTDTYTHLRARCKAYTKGNI